MVVISMDVMPFNWPSGSQFRSTFSTQWIARTPFVQQIRSFERLPHYFVEENWLHSVRFLATMGSNRTGHGETKADRLRDLLTNLSHTTFTRHN